MKKAALRVEGVLEVHPISALPDSMGRFCTHCDKPLRREFVWLEMNCKTALWYVPGNVPENESQGCFPLGVTCARNVCQ